jgi:Kef-type K+ transport system membrane component KefB
MENIWFIAAAWLAMALIASLISIRLGISVALIEMFVGVIAGNFLGFHTTPWIDFLATFGSGLLTFLAGAEIDPESLRKHLKPSLVIGSISALYGLTNGIIDQRHYTILVTVVVGEEVRRRHAACRTS